MRTSQTNNSCNQCATCFQWSWASWRVSTTNTLRRLMAMRQTLNECLDRCDSKLLTCWSLYSWTSGLHHPTTGYPCLNSLSAWSLMTYILIRQSCITRWLTYSEQLSILEIKTWLITYCMSLACCDRFLMLRTKLAGLILWVVEKWHQPLSNQSWWS